MGMNTICRIQPKAPRTRSSRFVERYSACRGSLAEQLARATRPADTDAASAVTPQPSFSQLFSRAFTQARQ